MEFKDMITLAVTSGLVAGVISTIGSIIISIFEKKSDAKLERMKYANSLNDFRYKELTRLLDELTDSLYTFDETIGDIVKRGENLQYELYADQEDAVDFQLRRIRPLLDDGYWDRIDKRKKQVLAVKKAHLEQIVYGTTVDPRSTSAAYIVDVMGFFDDVILIIQEQLIELIVKK